MPSAQQHEEALFRAAVELPSAATRRAFLDQACAGDLALLQRLEALLAAHEEPDEMASEPAAVAATIKLNSPGAEDEAVGQTLGRYKLLEKVGEGGCGVVYVAEQTEPVRRRVALKVIKLGMDTKAVVARFEAERQALAMMDHPNIAKVLDAGTTETGRPFFVMELVRGIRITEYCDQNQLSTNERLDLFIKVCQAIQHAHQKGIIHRDIKPSNILVTLHDGIPVPKVIDFGIAKATEGRLTDATVYTQLHQFIGTPAYMSPEQAEMSGLDIDTRSDIYSLGVLLYELLAGSTPFDGKELIASGIDAMRKMIREKEPVRPSTRFATLKGEELTTTAKRRSAESAKLLHQLKGDLDWIVMKCLEKDRTRRYETANGLAYDLKRHLNNEPVLARPPSAAYKFQKSFRRNKLVFTAATAVSAALILGLAVSSWQMVAARQARNSEKEQRLKAQGAQKVAESERRVAESERERADGQARKAIESQEQSQRLLYDSDMNLAQQALKLNNLGRARRLLDRHRPQPGEEDLRGWEWRYLWQLIRNEAIVTLTNRPARGFSAGFSPDGSRLAVGWYDGRVDLWDVPGRRWVRSLTAREDLSPAHVAFSPVQNLLAATSESNAITLYDFDSGRQSILWRGSEQGPARVNDLAFSQDGTRMVISGYSTARRDAAVWVVNVSSSEVESRHAAGGNFSEHHGAARLSPDNRRLYLSLDDTSNYRYGIQCLDLVTGQEIWKTAAQKDYGLTAMAISPDGRTLASGSGFEDPTIRIWDTATGHLLVRLDGHTSWIGKLIFTQDGRRLFSAAADQTIREWDTGAWTEIRTLRGHSDEVHALAVSDSAHLIASASKDGNLMLWEEDGQNDTDGHRRVLEEIWHGSAVPLNNGRLLLLPGGKRPALFDLWQATSAQPLPGLGMSSNMFDWEGSNFIRWDGTNRMLVEQWNGSTFIPRGAVNLGAGARPNSVVFNPARQQMAWSEASASNSIYLAALATPERRIELKCEIAGLYPVLFSDDGKYLAAESYDLNSLRVWNVETGQIVVSNDDNAATLTFAAGGRALVLSIRQGPNHEILFYDLTHGDQPPRRIPGRDVSLGLAVSPDGRLVASPTRGGLVRLFDPVKGELIATLHGHLNAAFDVAFSPDGRRLISSSGAREAIKIWDVDTRQELLTLAGTGSFLSSAQWSADGNLIVAGGPWQTWSAPSWEEIAAAEANEKAEVKQP